ncbi:MAG: twin-arginine translocase subunit TatC, partial [Halobacteriales archaeon]|nr:twin-arginine translocase subunit TatC [Halobacteriales archaeon]
SQQFVPPGVELVVTDPISAAMVQVEVALALALLIGSPLVAYEAASFLMPALLPPERKLLLRAIPAVTGLFLAGAAFAYLLMVPTMMRVLYSYALGLGARSLLTVDSLVSFALIVTVIFGLSFELPVFMVVLAKLGLVSPATMRAKWRHIVVGIFVLSAVITPDPSVISQVLVAVPLCVLYVAGLIASQAATKAPAAEGAASAA